MYNSNYLSLITSIRKEVRLKIHTPIIWDFSCELNPAQSVLHEVYEFLKKTLILSPPQALAKMVLEKYTCMVLLGQSFSRRQFWLKIFAFVAFIILILICSHFRTLLVLVLLRCRIRALNFCIFLYFPTIVSTPCFGIIIKGKLRG